MKLRADKESWNRDELGQHQWILDDASNYLAELITTDEEGLCRSEEEMEVIGALMEESPTLACFLRQALGLLLMCATGQTRPPSTMRRTMLDLVDKGQALFKDIGVIFTDQEEAAAKEEERED